MPKLVKTRVEIEGRVEERWAVQEESKLAPWAANAQLDVVGQPLPRIEGALRVTGRAKYTADLYLHGMLYGKFLRCPHPHATVKSLDTTAAAALPGVLAVYTADNLPATLKLPEPLLSPELRYMGEEVCAVIAESEDLCQEALDLIQVTYAVLPHVVSIAEAIKPGAVQARLDKPNVHPDEVNIFTQGDVEQGFAAADVVVEIKAHTPAQLHTALESHGAVAQWDGDTLTVHESTQHVFGVRRQLATIFDLPLNHVRVLKDYMGGGFGAKGGTGKWAVLAVLAAKHLHRPVKVMYDRKEENLATGHRNETVQVCKVGAKRDGTLTAIVHETWSAIGYQGWAGATGGPARDLYKCPNIKTVETPVRLNTGENRAFRGPGYVEGALSLEMALDEIALRIGLDPVDLRRKNYAETHPGSGRKWTSNALLAAYDEGAKLFDWLRQDRPASAPHKRRAVGVAAGTWGAGGGPPAYCEVRLNPDATATVLSGTQDLGTGTRTVLAQIVSEELGYPMERIAVMLGDTQNHPYAPASWGSITVSSVGPAAREAAAHAKQQLLELAEALIEVPADDLTIAGTDIVAKDGTKRLPVLDVTSKMGNFQITGFGSRGPNPEGYQINAFGVQFADVEVDTLTGDVTLLDFVAAHDAGRVINPLTLGSQVEGGIIQSIGWTMTENRVMDAAHGYALNANLEDYHIPTVQDLPPIRHVMVGGSDPISNNLGTKGIGEPPLIPTAPAICNAVARAIGVRPTQLPLSRAHVLALLAQGGAAR